MVECSHAVAPAIHCLLNPPRQPADHTPEAPSSTHQGRGAGPAPHRISRLRAISCALISLLAVHITPSLEHK
eukprot:28605-Pelagomonas_calceolata.AAC.2